VSPTVKWTLMAVLAAIAGGYFAVMVWKARPMARVLLPRGWAARGWNEPSLTWGLRLLGLLGLVLAAASVVTAVLRIVG
jgi:hypothetical protein